MNIELHVYCISVDMYASHALLLLYVYTLKDIDIQNTGLSTCNNEY